MRRQTIGELPLDHRQFRGVFEGVTDEGNGFRLEVRNGRQRLNSGEMVRAHMNAMTRGRPTGGYPMYKDTVEITLFVPNHYRTDIEILPNGMYRHGRHVERTLRDLVPVLVDGMQPRPAPAP